MKLHRDVLAAHAQFGGDLEGMQRRYDASVGNAGEAVAWQNIATLGNPEAPPARVVTDEMVEAVAAKFMAHEHGADLLGYPDGTYKSGILYSMRVALEAALTATPAPAVVARLQEIVDQARNLRRGGPDPIDLQGLSDGLERATDIAAELLATPIAPDYELAETVHGEIVRIVKMKSLKEAIPVRNSIPQNESSWEIGAVYNHTGSGKDERNPYYGKGFRCTFVTSDGWGVLEHLDGRPPKLELPTLWVLGTEEDAIPQPLVVGDQMDYMRG